MLAQTVNYIDFTNAQEQSNYLANKVASILQAAIEQNNQASIAVSGGSTPKEMFALLSNIDIPWQKVTITLVDDRWLEPSHNDSNQKLVEQNLLQNFAQKAHFIGLYQADKSLDQASEHLNQRFKQIELPFDIILLGMGNDGHTASLFPCSSEITQGMSTTQLFLATQPSSAPYTRMSLSANTISQAKHLFVQLKGQDKQQTLNKALAEQNELAMPIKRFLTNDTTVLWCP